MKDSGKTSPEKKLQTREDLIPIFIMGKRYLVPSSLTIQKAMEYAGYQLIRGCGCRGGICGACATVYRMPDSYKIGIGLACQTVVQPNMYLTQIPFFPVNRAVYDLEKLKPTGESIHKLYPEIFRCVACNTCTKSCPMDVQVMDYISAAIRGDIKQAAELSFDCIQCGLCTARCPGELPQYHIGQLARRLNGKYITPRAEHLRIRVQQIEEGRYESMLQELMKADKAELKRRYVQEREVEPDMAEEFWTPKETKYL
ncbi:MAG: 4Fe-4S dicluster domain-containing protein [candidate division KSB1 bacterium]|nr:4Fe-4S dicluster domain-containing protein [candidate division KSB1 bacterium]